jgi:hypothetical protein
MRMVKLADGRTMLRYRVDGCKAMVLPEFAGKGRADELWQTTCFELFAEEVKDGAYLEFNFSPSARWAAYHFQAYRDGQSYPDLATQPDIHVEQGEEILVLTAFMASADLQAISRIGVSAVIEEQGGCKSYWALAHPAGKPDFHDRSCFEPLLAAAGAS